MRVLVTGATGFLGRKTVSRLVDAGHEVVALTRNPKKASKVLAFPCRFHAWDSSREPVPAAAMEGVQAVIHLAGEGVAEKRWTALQKKKIVDSRVLGTRALVKAVREAANPPEVFVCASAIGYYGDTGDRSVDEENPPGSDFLGSVCVQWEAETKPLLTGPTRLVTMRTGVVLGLDGGALKALVPLFEWGLGGKVGSGRQWMSWIHVDDQVNLYLWALESPHVKGVLNGTSPEPVQNAEFAKRLGHALHRPSLLPAPAFALKLAMGELSAVVLSGTRALPRRTQALGYSFAFPTLEKALADLFVDGPVEILEREQFIPQAPQEIFPFFAEARNLEKITPPWMGFRVLKSSTERIEEGTLIDYRLTVHGVPMRWRTRIQEWNPGHRFVDTQLKGPYRYWHHTHQFIAVKGGTLMRDRVKYRLPGGSLGKLVAGRFVAGDVNTIFNYRWKKVEELFCRKQT
jgi:uncharacterized protein